MTRNCFLRHENKLRVRGKLFITSFWRHWQRNVSRKHVIFFDNDAGFLYVNLFEKIVLFLREFFLNNAKQG